MISMSGVSHSADSSCLLMFSLAVPWEQYSEEISYITVPSVPIRYTSNLDVEAT